MKYALLLAPLVCLALSSCTGKEYSSYAQAVKEQNITIQLKRAQDAKEKDYLDRKHQEKMMRYTTQAIAAAALTPDKSDDILVPMVMLVMEDKWATTSMVTKAMERPEQMHSIEAPETAGEFVQKSTGAILGIGAIALGVVQSNNTADIAIAGVKSAGTNLTVSGENNSMTSDSSTHGDTTTTITDNSDNSGTTVPEETESSSSSSD